MDYMDERNFFVERPTFALPADITDCSADEALDRIDTVMKAYLLKRIPYGLSYRLGRPILARQALAQYGRPIGAGEHSGTFLETYPARVLRLPFGCLWCPLGTTVFHNLRHTSWRERALADADNLPWPPPLDELKFSVVVSVIHATLGFCLNCVLSSSALFAIRRPAETV